MSLLGLPSDSKSSDVCARCPAAGSIRQALKRAVSLVEQEFPLLREGPAPTATSSFPQLPLGDCSALRNWWSSRKAALLVGRDDIVRRQVYQTLKSCDRFFDVECSICDRAAKDKALRKWQPDVATVPDFDPATSVSWSQEPILELKRRVRALVGKNWGRGIVRFREACLVPDQNGCLETTRIEGGTLATVPKFSSGVFNLRVGTVKTKGKFRVVTMQSAKVKEVLRPVHDCLYSFLSGKRWLARGDVTKEHVRLVMDGRLPGEDFISGDYEAATNNIYLPAVFAVVEVLSESSHLSEEERELLLGSFRAENLNWVSRSGRCHAINRGSMMGNLVSFCVLCLLNKACYDICCSIRRDRSGKLRLENAIINGDDIAFAGDQSFYNDWMSVTSHFGLVVNKEKTGVSSVFLELNSRTFLIKGSTIRPLRKPVLSALLPGTDPSCLLTRLWDGLRTLSPGGFRRMVVLLRHSIIQRGVTLSSIPVRLRRVFVKERWFRQALAVRPCVLETGVDRSWPVVLRDERPPDHLLPLYEKKKRELLVFDVSLVRGVKVRPRDSVISGFPTIPALDPEVDFVHSWSWKWFLPLWNWWESNLPLVPLGSSLWVDDHADLSVSVECVVRPVRFPPFLTPDVTVVGPGSLSDSAWRSLERAHSVQLARGVASSVL